MSDTPETPPAGADGPDGAAQPKSTVPPLQITAQYIKDLSFENPNAPSILTQRGQQPQVSVNVDVRTNALGSNTYEVILHLRGDAKSGDVQAFLVELDYGGIVTIGPEVNKQQAALLLSIEAPRHSVPLCPCHHRRGHARWRIPTALRAADRFRRHLPAANEGHAGTHADCGRRH